MGQQEHRIEVSAGRFIGWETLGTGPGLVLLHGAGRARQHLRPLAEALSGRFTVHLVDRNGRGLSLPRDDSGGHEAQAEDIAAVLRETGARFLFGHSSGGSVALATARVAALDKVAVYEPGVSIDGSFPLAIGTDLLWTIETGDYAGGQVKLARAVGALPGWLPEAPLRWLFGLLLRTDAGAEIRELMPLVEPDLTAAAAADGPASAFADIDVPVLVMWGARSPEFLRGTAQKLLAALPHGQGLELPGQGHNAPDLTAPGTVARHLERFLLG